MPRGDDRAVLTATALPGLPEVRPGDDLAALLAVARGELRAGDVLAVAHKVVSKAEGRVVALDGVSPGHEARALAAEHGKDPRHVQVILDESEEILRADRGRLICRTPHGFVCANAGVDASNAGARGTLVLLPTDPDASARALRRRLGCAVLITDSFGRPWRIGQSEVAIGCAGLAPADDWRGRDDADGRELAATVIAVADEAAAAADLVRTKDSREPAVRIRGLERHVTRGRRPGRRRPRPRREGRPLPVDRDGGRAGDVSRRGTQPVRPQRFSFTGIVLTVRFPSRSVNVSVSVSLTFRAPLSLFRSPCLPIAVSLNSFVPGTLTRCVSFGNCGGLRPAVAPVRYGELPDRLAGHGTRRCRRGPCNHGHACRTDASA